MKTNTSQFMLHNNQDGFILVVAMMILVVLALIGTYALNTAEIEMRIAGNDRQEKQVFYGTESGCLRGGQWLRNLQLTIVDDYADSDLKSAYIAAGQFNNILPVKDITETEEANLGDANYPVKYRYNIKETPAIGSTTTRKDCVPIPGNNPNIMSCDYDVQCDTVTTTGGAKLIAVRVAKPTDFN